MNTTSAFSKPVLLDERHSFSHRRLKIRASVEKNPGGALNNRGDVIFFCPVPRSIIWLTALRLFAFAFGLVRGVNGGFLQRFVPPFRLSQAFQQSGQFLRRLALRIVEIP